MERMRYVLLPSVHYDCSVHLRLQQTDDFEQTYYYE